MLEFAEGAERAEAASVRGAEAAILSSEPRYVINRPSAISAVKANVRYKTSRLVGFIRGLRATIEGLLQSRHQPPASAAGRI